MLNAPDVTSTRPYLIRAIHEWCVDNGFTPYLVVSVNDSVQVPREFVKDGEIVLNTSYDATSGLQLGNDFVEFNARFGGVPREIMVPVGRVVAVYARENGQGMAFPAPVDVVATAPLAAVASLALAGEKTSDASVESIAVAERSVVQLVSSDDDAGDEPPRPPSAPLGGRPSLKRVK